MRYSLQIDVYLYLYIAAGGEKLAQGFYTAATWLGIEPSIYGTL